MNQRELERFDMTKKPMRTAWYLRPLTYLLSAPDVRKHRAIITKTGADGLKPPYLLLCNHNAFLDFKVATKAIYPHRANYIVAIDGFIGREGLLRRVGCICKRKFTEDLTLIRQCKRVVQNGDVLVVYPEARYSLCGTTAVLPASLGKLCKLLGVPVVTLICHGHHIDSPFWNLHVRNVKPTEAEFTVQYTADELKATSADEINERLVQAFQYDEFAWQKARGIRVTYPKRAEGLHKVLYQCPACRTEFRMASEGATLYCKACGKRWHYTELGELAAEDGETAFSHIPDWYEWERQNVRAEIEAGTYSSGDLFGHGAQSAERKAVHPARRRNAPSRYDRFSCVRHGRRRRSVLDGKERAVDVFVPHRVRIPRQVRRLHRSQHARGYVVHLSARRGFRGDENGARDRGTLLREQKKRGQTLQAGSCIKEQSCIFWF